MGVFLLMLFFHFLSRFDSMITFGLPDHENRQEIAAQYAKHLTKAELAELATATEEYVVYIYLWHIIKPLTPTHYRPDFLS